MGLYNKAGDGNRTHLTSLEGWCFTTKLHPLNLRNSQISKEANFVNIKAVKCALLTKIWRGFDLYPAQDYT